MFELAIADPDRTVRGKVHLVAEAASGQVVADDCPSCTPLSHHNEETRTWSEELLDELATQLATHPRFEALVQARVQQVLAQHEKRDRVWLTLKEAVERLGCSPDAVRMRINRGRFDHRRQGRRLYVSAVSIDHLDRAA